MHCSSWNKSFYHINNALWRLLSPKVLIIFYTYTFEVILPTFHRWLVWSLNCPSNIPSELLIPLLSSFLLATLSLLLSMKSSQFFNILCSFPTNISKFTDILLFMTHNYSFLWHLIIPSLVTYMVSPFLLWIVLSQHLDKRFLPWDIWAPLDITETGGVMKL